MKKLLSILVCVVLGVGCVCGADIKHTLTATVCNDVGGTVAVQGSYRGSKNALNLYWHSQTSYSTTSISAETWASTGFTGRGSYSAKMRLYASASEGYYFVGWYDGCNGSKLNYSAESGDIDLGCSKNVTTYSYYALFKHYRYGYSDGRTAKISEGAEFGDISLDSINWSDKVGNWSDEVESSAFGEMKTLRQQGDATDSESDVITLTYYAKLKDANYFFLGWFLDEDGTIPATAADETYTNLTYTHKFYPTSEDANNPSTVPTLYAKFGKKALYKDSATANVVLVDADDVYLDQTQEELLKLVGSVFVSKEENPSSVDYATPTHSVGTGNVLPIEANAASGHYYYTYHAKANDSYVFVGWATNLNGENGKVDTIIPDLKYRHQHFTGEQDEAKAPKPDTLYAVFKQNTYYFYKGAVAGFTTNGEKGRITVTGKYYNEAKEGEALKDYRKETENEDIDDSGSTYNTELNNRRYSYTYEATVTDDKTAFKGWSHSPNGGNIITTVNPYTVDYTTFALTRDNAASTNSLYAVFQSYWYNDPVATAGGAGTVAATYSESRPADNASDWKTVIPTADEPNQVAASGENHKYSVWYHAKPNFGAYFAGWANVNDASQLITDDKKNPYKVDYVVTSTDDTAPFVSSRLYAIFKSVIEIIQQDRMIYYVDTDGNENINDANVIINFNKADKLIATLQDNTDIFEISDKQKVSTGTTLELDATSGIMQLVVSYIGTTPEEHIGETATITLSAEYTDENGASGTASIDVKIKIEREPFVTFLPTDGKGAYTIKHTDGRGIGYSMPKDATENINVSIAQENMATFELELTEDLADDGLTFAGWQMIVDNVSTYFAYDKKCTYTFKESAFVRPVFLADDRAVFTILGDNLNRKYYDLQLALNDAKTLYDADPNKQQQVVVFSNEDKVEGTLYQGNYIVPSGVMLLIPGVGPTPIKVKPRSGSSMIDDPFRMSNEADLLDGKNRYVYRTKRVETISQGKTSDVVLFTGDYTDVSDAANSSHKAPYASCYRKLKVEDNTSILVENGGTIQLYSVLSRSGQTYEASPYRYGQIELGENCRINVQSGAELHAFGYITGAHSSRVTAESGAEVHEVFQYSDPRGGTGVAHLFLNRKDYKVFPFAQYYIQNVEVPLEIKSGATEYITVTADVLKPFVLMTKFIIPEDGNDNTIGLFRLGNNTSLVKYYDPLIDRQKLLVKGEGEDASAKFGYIKVEMGDLSGTVGDMLGSDLAGWFAGIIMNDLRDVNLNSKEYVLPFNNNMDISIENATVGVSSSFAFMAGATMTIDENSTVNINSGANIYIYDADQNKLPGAGENYGYGYGYFGNEKSQLEPITATPNNSQYVSGTTTHKRQAKDIADANWLINGRVNVNSGAGLYTTSSRARLVSTKKGEVHFSSTLKDATTLQAKYNGGGASALLQGVDGVHTRVQYPVTSAKLLNANGNHVATSANTFYYNPEKGQWLNTPSAEHNPLQGAEVRVTLPDYDLTSQDVDSWPIMVSSVISGVREATIKWDNPTSTTVNVSYNQTILNLSFGYTPKNKAGEYRGVLSFGNNNQIVTVIEDYTPQFSTIDAYSGVVYLGYSYEIGVELVPDEKNVAGILSGDYEPEWNVEFTGEHADEFSFVWGEGDAELTDAKIVFKPKTSGSKTALLSLTCTYTDKADVKHTTTKAIPLSATVNTLSDNTLAFANGIENIFVSDAAKDLLGNVNNSNGEITITPAENSVVTITQEEGVYKIAPKAKGSVTITVTQAADLVNGVAGTTITKTITVTDDIVWNWEHLYFGSENTNPVTTKYENWSLEVAEDEYDVILDLIGDELGYLVKVQNWEAGEAKVTFRFSYGDNEDTKTFTSTVYRDPRYLPFTVNDDRIYEAVTWAHEGVSHSGVDVTFTPSSAIAQWTFTFKGIPDILSFTAQGKGKWQIEESPNGTNWSITHTWATIASGTPFELELQPATRYVRISYGQGDVKGVLTNVTVSELTSIRADVDKLYMPITDGGVTKNVVFTYVSEDGYNLSTSRTEFGVNPNTLDGLAEDPYYQIKRVGVNSNATEELTGALSVTGTELSIPIKAFVAPQAIPIQLASDHQERYYYVTTNTYKAYWNMDSRKIEMHNAVADADPYVVFHFADAPAPGIISFNYTATSQGTWVIEESEDATNWIAMEANDTEDLDKQFVMRDFAYPEASRYVRVTYVSDYAEIIELSNLAILPTSNVTVNPSELVVYDNKAEKLSVTANNLKNVSFVFTPTDGFKLVDESEAELTADNLTSYFVKAGGGTLSKDIYVKYVGSALATYGKLEIKTTEDNVEKVLATVQLIGLKRNLPVGETGIKTGTSIDITNFDKSEGKEAHLRDVNTAHAFENGIPLFDYVIIYGETTTTDNAQTVTAPTSAVGSNAKTPCYIYKVNNGAYELVKLVENANSSQKSWSGAIEVPDSKSLKVYITGFCPYASIGYSKSDNGVWHFKGDNGDNIDIYLEDCYIYSRYKSKRGNSFSRSNGETYSDKVARGSGAVLLFENNTESSPTAMNVTIHTRGTNLLKSHYGCLFESIVGRAFQISSPVQIYMQSAGHFSTSYTELNFTDEWPTAVDGSATERTNGFLSLQKQVNNAPSIDMGNANTVVNFRGGQVELQNALNSSDNYESTLAISYRTGMYGPAKFRFELSYGIGTDGTDGRVNFYDGTTTVIPMTVPERYRQYYLMDEDGTTTSCLRTPKKTFVYGGSHCMMRACPQPTDKGGAPTDGDYSSEYNEETKETVEIITGNPLGLYEYTGATTPNGSYGLVTPTEFPGTLEHKDTKVKLSDVHANYPEKAYGVNSVTPVNGKLNFWIPAGYVEGVAPEVNKAISYWKACMTYIEAKYGVYDGHIGGGETTIGFSGEEQAEEVQNLLYCQIDQNISDVISSEEYSAPVLNPAPVTDPSEKYLSIAPTQVGTELQNYIQTKKNYKVENRVYYIVPATADVWMAFTAPFDVENVYVMETVDESVFVSTTVEERADMLKLQAQHNADFAAFFGVALALESKKDFESIYKDYIGWAKQQDKVANKWNGEGEYTLRGKYELEHYYVDPLTNNGNWSTASYYLYKNSGPWVYDEEKCAFVPKVEVASESTEGTEIVEEKSLWEFVVPPAEGEPLMLQGQTYSMLFPYCVGCDVNVNEDEEIEVEARTYWDYWTGKFLIFESTDGGADGHTIYGADYVQPNGGLLAPYTETVENQASLLGNPTFAQMEINNSAVWTYNGEMAYEGFDQVDGDDFPVTIEPTESFLLANLKMPVSAGYKIKRITRDGKLQYVSENTDDDGPATGGHVPTINGGSDLFVTSRAEGINIAVSEPQAVGVFSATGALLYSGWVETSVDVNLVVNGVYVVVGENESVKIIY